MNAAPFPCALGAARSIGRESFGVDPRSTCARRQTRAAAADLVAADESRGAPSFPPFRPGRDQRGGKSSRRNQIALPSSSLFPVRASDLASDESTSLPMRAQEEKDPVDVGRGLSTRDSSKSQRSTRRQRRSHAIRAKLGQRDVDRDLGGRAARVELGEDDGYRQSDGFRLVRRR